MTYKKIKYPDGSFYPQITDFSNPVITERINSYEDLWFIRQLKDICDANKVPVSLQVPCLLDGQADRRFNKNESSNLKLICNFINDMKFESVEVFHPHNAEVVEDLIDFCTVKDNSVFINRVLYNLRTEHGMGAENLIIMSPDAGAYKWITKLADKLEFAGEVYGASKSRKFEGGKSVLTQFVDKQDFEGKSILLVDDICIYGGSAIGLATLLEERNTGQLFFAISHLTVQNPNPELFKMYDHIYCTNSKYDVYSIPDRKNQSQTPENLSVIKLF